MKKNLIIIILSVAFTASLSWNWIGNTKAKTKDNVADTVDAVTTYVGNGGVFSNVSGADGTFQLTFVSPPNEPASILTVTITNIDNEDISYSTN